jgi:hypothetical protein
MIMLRAILASLAIAVAVTAPAAAQEMAPIEKLRTLFVPLMGAARVEVIDYDVEGRIEYQSQQLREFRVVAGGRQIRETLLMRDSHGRIVEGGMVLHGLDFDTGRVSTWTFWGQAGDGLMAVSQFEGAGDDLRLVGIGVTQVDGREARIRSEFRRESGNLVWRTYLRPAGGREYLDHIITYRPPGTEIFPVQG